MHLQMWYCLVLPSTPGGKRMDGCEHRDGRWLFPRRWHRGTGRTAWPCPASAGSAHAQKLCHVFNASKCYGRYIWGALHHLHLHFLTATLHPPTPLPPSKQLLLRALTTFCYCKYQIFLCPLSWPLISVEQWRSLPPSWSTLFLWLSWVPLSWFCRIAGLPISIGVKRRNSLRTES